MGWVAVFWMGKLNICRISYSKILGWVAVLEGNHCSLVCWLSFAFSVWKKPSIELENSAPSEVLVRWYPTFVVLCRGTVFGLRMFELSSCLFPQLEEDHRCDVWWETSGGVWLW